MNTEKNVAQTVPKYMVPAQFAEYTGLPISLVRQMVKSGELTGFKSGAKTTYILVESYKDLAHSLATK